MNRAGFGTALLLSFSVGATLLAQTSEQVAPVPPLQAQARCRVEGRVTSGALTLPGASVLVFAGEALKAATSTDFDGKYTILFAPDATYRLSVELTAFARAERNITLGPAPCDTRVDFSLSLEPRRQLAAAATKPTTPTSQPGARNAGQRFQTLNVQSDARGAATLESLAADENGDINRLLPPGFDVQTAQSEAVAINGSGDATALDRGLMNERLQAINLGQLDPATGQFAPGIGPDGGPGAMGQNGPGFGGPGGPGNGRFGGPDGPGGPGGPGGFMLGGRGARGQNRYQGSTMYTFGGSALNAPPYQLRPDVPVTQPEFAQNTFGATFGGPFKIPKLYEDTNGRSSFQLNYTGNRSDNLFDQYATVPTDAMRHGDFSSTSIQLFDPTTGQAFAGNQIPSSRINPAAQALVGYIPEPNLPGTSKNFHVSTTARTTSDNVSLRFTQNLSPSVTPVAGAGARAGGGQGGARGGFGGGFPGGFGGFGGRGTNILLNVQLQYRRNQTEALNVFPDLGGITTNTSLAAPVSLIVVRNRTIQRFTVNLSHLDVAATNSFSGVQNVAGDAGINYPGPVDPFNWGVPNLLFSGFTGLRGASASERIDNRLTTSYSWMRPVGKHRIRIGGDYRFDTSVTQTNANPRGTFTFTGVYATGGAQAALGSGADFADFLLGVPQQATLQVGGTTRLHGHAFGAFIEDNWQKSAKLTFNVGLRYELVMPYYELSGQMVNLDVAPGFTSVAPVLAGGTGPISGVSYPNALLNPDINNIGPRIGAAYRITPSTILRGGYSITYNPGSYAAIARQLVAQPPFAQTETVAGLPRQPLSLENALVSSTEPTTNNYGVDRDYALGQIQIYNGTIVRNFGRVWSISAGYTGAKGTDLDLLSAPNRGATGLLIPDVQPFTWESSDGRSTLNLANFQIIRRLAHGVSGSASYTLSKSMDNTPSLGAGGTVVAQDPRNLGAEWALSNFDRYQQFTGNLLVELPFGPNRRWLANGGTLAGIVGGWSATFNFIAASGNPLTPRVVGAATNVSQGINGALRADYLGGPIQEADPTVNEFFNTAAFAVPATLFGNAGRNIIIGPGSHQLNGTLVRDVRLGGNRAVTLQVNANNLLNTVQWAAVDTNINSPTFGEVLSARPMRTVTVTARFRF